MTKKGSQELRECKRELRKIIKELESISSGVRGDFRNIGNDKCASSIDSVIYQYKQALKKLDSIEPSTIDKLQEEAKAIGAGGTSGGGGSSRRF